VKVAFVIVVGSMAALNVALMVLLAGTFRAALAGFVTVIVGATAFAVAPVVKVQTKLAVMAMLVRFLAALVIVTVYCVFAARLAVGVKMADLLAVSQAAEPGTPTAPIVSITVNVPGAEIVAGSMDVLKVAEIL